jgi:recombination protein RecA
LDAIIGVPGIPRGRLIELGGDSGAGKSTLCSLIAANAQRQYPDELVVYVDCEQCFDLEYSRKLGLDTSEDRFLLIQPDSGVQALTVMEEFCEAGICSVIILDSIASLRTEQEVNGDVGDQHMAVLARLLAAPMKNLTSSSKKTNTAILFVNQIRRNLGQYRSAFCKSWRRISKILPFIAHFCFKKRLD